MEKRLADEIREKYGKKYTFKDLTDYITEDVRKTYEDMSKGLKHDWPAWEVYFRDVTTPSKSKYNAVDSSTDIEWPKSNDYGKKEINKWFEDNGFVWETSNHQSGWRIKF